jgi:hypothetical protein
MAATGVEPDTAYDISPGGETLFAIGDVVT